MASILDLLLRKEITALEIVDWILYKDIKEYKKQLLHQYENQRVEFVPFYLNYLREQVSPLVQNSQSTGLTPKKAKSHIQAHKKLTPSQTGDLIRTQLFPSPVGNACNNDRISVKLSYGNQKFRRQEQSFLNESGHKHFNTRFEPKVHPKLNLGQFIQPHSYVTPVTHKKKTIQPIAVRRNENSYEHDSRNSNRIVELNLNDPDSFPTVNESQTRKRERKVRISPTSLSNGKNRVQDSFQSENFLCEEILKEQHCFKTDKQTVPQSFHSNNAYNGPFVERLPENSMTQSIDKENLKVEITEASPKNVSFKKEIDLLLEVYCALLNENLIPNLSVELYFIMQLLTVRSENLHSSSTVEENNFLITVHNCVYFSVQVLSRQRSLLRLLDKTTIKLLADNPRIDVYSSNLKNYLVSILRNQKQVDVITAVGKPIQSVSFQSDTDNRNNFPDDQTFHNFRKQRDSFYEILREWENNHLNPGWSMSVNLGNKIRTLICTWTDPSIYPHLARLFLGQMIAMCKGDACLDKNENHSEDLELIALLKHTNPEKCKRLQERFVIPFHVAGPSPLPFFAGPQEFFCDFISLASCPGFNQHVTDNLVFQILEFNEGELLVSDNEDCNNNSDKSIRLQFRSLLMTIRTLAKFLGFMIFTPYKSIERLPQEHQTNSVAMRNKIPFLLDLKSLLHKAIKSQRLTLTVPWIVEFLSMMDANALQLHSVNEAIIGLVYLYRSSLFSLKQEKFSLNNLFLLLSVGWLFEIHNISSSLFLMNLSDAEADCFKVKNTCSKGKFSLDFFDLIDHHILYTCCPYLGELKMLLGDFAAGLTNRSSVIKKIIPTSAKDDKRSSVSVKQLEMELEENFFHNHPSSLRKTVEFVAERMSSNAIMHVKKEIIPEIRKEGYTKLYTGFLEILKQRERIKASIATLKQTISTEMCASVVMQINDYFSERRIQSALKLHLAEDVDKGVLKVCSEIASRLSKERVSHWISVYVTPDLFNDELQNEIEKLKKLNASPSGKVTDYKPPSSPMPASSLDFASFSPTDVLIHIKAFVRDVYMGVIHNCEEIDEVLKDMKLLLQPVVDVTQSVRKALFLLTEQLLLGLVFFHPDSVTEENMDGFITIWEKNPSVCSSILCPQNLMFLQMSPSSEKSWKQTEVLLLALIRRKVLDFEAFENQCLHILKQKWPEGLIQSVNKCIDNIQKACENR